MSDHHLLVPCTSRKRRTPAADLRIAALPRGSARDLARIWSSKTVSREGLLRASELYCGRSVTEAVRAAEQLGASLYFISAGLGLVESTRKIPSYNLSATRGAPDSIAQKIETKYDAGEWWTELTKSYGTPDPIKSVAAKSRGLLIVAVPKSYLPLVVGELQSIGKPAKQRLRIIGPRSCSDLPAELHENWMPYDARLDDRRSGYSGTASDFPQRALRHFVEKCLRVLGGSADAATHARQVELELKRYKRPKRPSNMPASDDAVLAAMKTIWVRERGLRSNVLRALRSELNIACEQKRFKNLADKLEKAIHA